MSWLDGITNSMDMSLSKVQEIVKDREACYAADHGIEKGGTQLSNRTTTTKEVLSSDPNSPRRWLWPWINHFTSLSFSSLSLKGGC